MQPTPIRLTNLAKSFDHAVKGHIFAVDDVNLEVSPGELLTLLGPSGCGKTTTLRMIAGFEQPTAGSIRIGDRDVTRLRANQRNIGFVFQNYAIFPHLSVFENVGYGLRVQDKPPGEIQRAVDEVLALVGLTGYARQQPHQLSGGEQQRIALARAIVIQPRTLLFDEPLSNLDARLRVQMREEIRQLQKRLGITTVYVTHDQEEAMAISDRIAVMDRGAIAQIGTAEDLYHRPVNEFVARFIGRTNLLPARFRSRDPGSASVDVLGQVVSVALPAQVDAADDCLQAMIRPEQLTLATGDGPGLRAVVQGRSFLGEKTEYRLAVGEHSLQATVFGDLRFGAAQGESVRVILPAAGVHLIAS